MKAAYLLDGKIQTGAFPDPEPGPSQVLVKTCCCGMCASDLHMAKYGADLVKWSNEYDGPFKIDLSKPLIMGHEFVGEIVDYGPDTKRTLEKGRRVTAFPLLTMANDFRIVGLSTDCPGGYGEYMILNESTMLAVPDSLDTDLAAMTEPVGVGLGYVHDARLTAEDTPLVIGCGAIGLATIMALKLTAARPIIASDHSPERRRLAELAGADIVIDPRERSPYADQNGHVANVIFECVGVPGVIDEIIRNCAARARIIVSGWCLEPDHMLTVCTHTKALNIQFGGGPNYEIFERALAAIAGGRIDPSSWLGDRIGLDEVSQAMEKIADPNNPIRTLVHPSLG